MKKFLLSILSMVVSLMAMQAEEATVTLSFASTDNRAEYSTSKQVWAQNGITLINNKSSSTTSVADYSNPARFYKDSEIIIECNGGNITKIVFVCNLGSHANALGESITDDVNTSVSSNKVTVTLDGTSSNFTIASLSGGQVRMDAVTVTYVTDGEVRVTCATPVISPASGEITADTEISIECATEDATIKYTIDGTEPSAENGTEYIEPFTLNADATVRAIAIKEGCYNSAITTATYTMCLASEYSYRLATSVENGGHYIIVGKDGESYFAMGEQKENNRGAVEITYKEGVIANPIEKVCEFELQENEGAWTFYDYILEGYLYSASSSSNQIKTQAEVDDNGKATIEIDETTGVATIKFKGENKNWMRYNSQSGLFSCYASGQQDIYLYQRVGDIPTGIEDTMVDENAPVEYYNLQGVKVANPENGIFIKKQGGRTSKVVL